MATGKTHFALSLTLPLATNMLFGTPLPNNVVSTAALIAGGLLPDLDGQGEAARWGNWLPNIIPAFIKRTLNKIGLSLSGLIKAMLGHRGPLHWLEWAFLFFGAGYLMGWQWVMWLGVGWGTHWLGDVVTRQGAPALILFGRKISLSPFRVGGRIEGLISFALWSYLIIWLVLWAVR